VIETLVVACKVAAIWISWAEAHGYLVLLPIPFRMDPPNVP
jgi:hypothetical protein